MMKPRDTSVIDSILEDETPEDAAAARPLLVQLRAAADREIPAPSAALRLLLDAPAPAAVTQLDAFRTRRELKGQSKYGARRRIAATSLAAMTMLGAGTGVAAAMDGGVRQHITASVANVGDIFGPGSGWVAPDAPAPVVVAEPDASTAPETAAPGVPATPSMIPSPGAQADPEPSVDGAPAGGVDAQLEPEKAKGPGESKGSGKDEGTGADADTTKPAKSDDQSPGNGNGNGNAGNAGSKDVGRGVSAVPGKSADAAKAAPGRKLKDRIAKDKDKDKDKDR